MINEGLEHNLSPYFWKKVGKKTRDVNVRNMVINLNLKLNKKLYMCGFNNKIL